MKIKKNISLKNKNWFRTGGKSKYFCQPKNESEFIQALNFAKTNNLQIFVLGKGANILISDDGFNGLTINPQLKEITIKKDTVMAQAGVCIQDINDYCLKNNLIDLEEFSCIPGTVGGSVFINIHYFEYFLSDFLINAKVINKKTNKIIIVDKSWFNFSYDQSKLHKREHFLISATFKLKKVNNIKKAYAIGRRDEIIRQRKRHYPTSNTCGCFFRNFHDNEIKFKINGKPSPNQLRQDHDGQEGFGPCNKKITAVAYYLDKLGIKGELRVGNAIVSRKHANMIETLPKSTSSDVIHLAQKMQQLVFDKYGIIPQAECQLVGFYKTPFYNFISQLLTLQKEIR